MAEIQLARIKSLYGELKGYSDAIQKGGASSSGPYAVPRSIVDNFNNIVDELTNITDTNYSRSKIPENELRNVMSVRLVEPLVGGLVNRLEQEYGFNESNSNAQPTIAIFNKNNNTNTIEINFTLEDLIRRTNDEQSKEKLTELKHEIEMPTRNWDKIKPILIWLINSSKDLFIQVVPIILEKKI